MIETRLMEKVDAYAGRRQRDGQCLLICIVPH